MIMPYTTKLKKNACFKWKVKNISIIESQDGTNLVEIIIFMTLGARAVSVGQRKLGFAFTHSSHVQAGLGVNAMQN